MLSLFPIVLASATLLPGGSEAWLAHLWCEGGALWALWLTAIAGDSLGSLINVALGRYARRSQQACWFPASPRALARAEAGYRRFGEWSLLLCWAPLIGDALAVGRRIAPALVARGGVDYSGQGRSLRCLTLVGPGLASAIVLNGSTKGDL